MLYFRVFEEMHITLAINCSEEVKRIESKPPLYRCRNLPLLEQKKLYERKSNNNNNNNNNNVIIEELLRDFDVSYDWIELEKSSYDRLEKADPIIIDKHHQPFHGDTRTPSTNINNHGNNNNSNHNNVNLPKGSNKWPQGRVLLYSRLGFDRPCMIAAAYIIRRWGMSTRNAISIITKARAGTNICPLHLAALELWSQKYTLGALLCTSCTSELRSEDSKNRHHHYNNHHWLEHKVKISSMLLDSIKSRLSSSTVRRMSSLGADISLYLQIAHKCESIPAHMSNMTENNISRDLLHIYDLNLSGSDLQDVTVVEIFRALAVTGTVSRLRQVRLANNKISCGGISTVMETLLSCGASGGDSELTLLDLAHNRYSANNMIYSMHLCYLFVPIL